MDMKMSKSLNINVNMSRLRWVFAALLAALALVAAARSMSTYQAHGMTTGLLAVIALAFLLIVGQASLGLARLRIARELAGLRLKLKGTFEATANGPTGASELLAARRARLEVIRASGASPDREVLAETTRADEASRAYIGRYLVATTVLIGLVGTFGGLMQTLGKMAPLFGAGDNAALDAALFAAPLAGLHVTFGASLVAILSTLALALAQGDLTLAEEQALTLLEDRTTHELIPAMWPKVAHAPEPTNVALEALKATFAEGLTRSLEANLKAVAETTAAVSERLAARGAAAVEEQARVSAAAIAETGARTAALLEESVRRTTALVEELLRAATATADTVARATTDTLSRTLAPLFAGEAHHLEGVRAALGEVGARVDVATGKLAELAASLEGSSRAHVAAIDRGGQAVLAAFDRAVVGGGTALQGAAGSLAAAARDLQTGAEQLVPRIGGMTTELGALSREVALLIASRGPDGDVGAVVLEELERLGAGMDRLTELVRLATAPSPSSSTDSLELDAGIAGEVDAAVESERESS